MRLITVLIVLSAMAAPAYAAHSNPHPGWTCHCDSAGNPHVHKPR